MPATVKNAFSHYLRHRNDMNLIDVVWSLIEALPSGLYDNHSLQRFVTENMRERGLTDSFAETLSELYVIATDLDTGDRVVFGREPGSMCPEPGHRRFQRGAPPLPAGAHRQS